MVRSGGTLALATWLALVSCGSRTSLDALGVDPTPTSSSPRDSGSSTRSPGTRDPGCSDGEREGFTDVPRDPDIAGCSGAWTVPGIHTDNPGIAPACGIETFDTRTPACSRTAGDDGPNPLGSGCNVEDLCDTKWHVCLGSVDVAAHSVTGCAGATIANDAPMFFATRQSSNGCGVCATGSRSDTDCDGVSCSTRCAQTPVTSNDFFGCGNYGGTSPIVDCGPLDRFSNDQCTELPGWSCENSYCEAYTVTKSTTLFGGVLCCRD